jgi:broad specificity phosphatase PhoE
MTASVPTITLVRHGETEWSKNGKHTSVTDLPLTPEGERVAKLLAGRLAGTTFDAVVSSPRARAVRTAELAGFAPTLDADFAEWDYGEYEGLTTAEIRKSRPGWDLFADGCPGGESVAAITARADRAVAKLKARTGPVLVFAHGHVCRVLAARWVGQPVGFARHLLLGTATVSRLGFDHGKLDEPAVALWNS